MSKQMSLNAKGDPEYATIVTTIDRTQDRLDVHVDRSKGVSTREPEQVLAALAAHYGEPALMKNHSRLIETGADEDVIYVYRPKSKLGTIEVVAGTGGYRALIDHSDFGDGSNLMADRIILRWILDMERIFGQRSLMLLRVDDMIGSGGTEEDSWGEADNDNGPVARERRAA